MKLIAGCGHKTILGEAMGIDINFDYVRKSKASSPAALYIQADLRNIPAKDHSFAFIDNWDVLEHVPFKEEIVSELARVAKPGAKVEFSAGLRECDVLLGRLSRTYNRIVTNGFHRSSLSSEEYLGILSRHFVIDEVIYKCSAYVFLVMMLLDPLKVTITGSGEYLGRFAKLLFPVAQFLAPLLQPFFNLLARSHHEKLTQSVVVYCRKPPSDRNFPLDKQAYPVQYGTRISHPRHYSAILFRWLRKGGVARQRPVEAKRVPIAAAEYDDKYFLCDCDGYQIFKQSRGRELPERLGNFFERLVVRPEDRALEIGCGRGEVCNALAPHVRSVIGIDYSSDAVRLCRQTYNGDSGNLTFMVADAKKLPFPAASFDLVVSTEVLKHLHQWELTEIVKEVTRVLDVDGRFVAQTEPNRPYRLLSSVWSFLPRAFKAVWRGQVPRLMLERPVGHAEFHVNEQTYWSLTRLLKDHFREYKVIPYEMTLGMNKARRFAYNAYPLNQLPGLRLLLNREMVVFCEKPKKSKV